MCAPPVQMGECESYCPDWNVLRCDGLPAGLYTIILSTYQPGDVGTCAVSVCARHNAPTVSVTPLCTRDPALERVIKSEWSVAAGTAVGCSNHSKYHLNPRFTLHVPARPEDATPCEISLTLQVTRVCVCVCLTVCVCVWA